MMTVGPMVRAVFRIPTGFEDRKWPVARNCRFLQRLAKSPLSASPERFSRADAPRICKDASGRLHGEQNLFFLLIQGAPGNDKLYLIN
jgi:hypothetical protein